MRTRFQKRTRSKVRVGAATVELAFCLPAMLLIVMGTIEVCQRIFLRQSAVLVAYEGARLAVRSTSSTGDVLARCNQLLIERRIQNGVVTVTPSDLLTITPGTQIRVTIAVPYDGNTPVSFALGKSGTLSVDAYMLRE